MEGKIRRIINRIRIRSLKKSIKKLEHEGMTFSIPIEFVRERISVLDKEIEELRKEDENNAE